VNEQLLDDAVQAVTILLNSRRALVHNPADFCIEGATLPTRSDIRKRPVIHGYDGVEMAIRGADFAA
jgi:hypothetical protein